MTLCIYGDNIIESEGALIQSGLAYNGPVSLKS